MTTMLQDPFAAWLSQGRQAASRSGMPPAFVPETDLLTGEREVRVVMDVPGLKVEDLEIEFLDGQLTIRGERRYPYREEQGAHELNRLERGFGRFERSLRVPREVDPKAVEASIDAGVLTLMIPLPDSRRPHRVEIREPGRDTVEVGAKEHALDAPAGEESREAGTPDLVGTGV